VQDDVVTWHRVIQPREQVALYLHFGSDVYASEVTWPGAVMEFYDPEDNAVVAVSSDPITFRAKTALHAHCSALDLDVTPGSHQTVAVRATNVDTASARQGDLSLHVEDIHGAQVFSTSVHVSLGAGASGDYPFAYQAPEEGYYVLEVRLNGEGEMDRVVHELVTVRQRSVYVPIVLRGYDSGTLATAYQRDR
jgi:hypothetical protein